MSNDNMKHLITHLDGGEPIEQYDSYQEACDAAKLISVQDQPCIVHKIDENDVHDRPVAKNIYLNGVSFEVSKALHDELKMPEELPIAKRKIQQLIDQGGEYIRDAKIIRMPDGKECCADVFGRCVWITPADPSKVDVEQNPTLPTPELIIRNLARISRDFAEQSSTAALETAGLLVSVLAENPEYIRRLLIGELTVMDLSSLNIFHGEAGCLNFCNANGEVIEVNTLRKALNMPEKTTFSIHGFYRPIDTNLWPVANEQP